MWSLERNYLGLLRVIFLDGVKGNLGVWRREEYGRRMWRFLRVFFDGKGREILVTFFREDFMGNEENGLEDGIWDFGGENVGKDELRI